MPKHSPGLRKREEVWQIDKTICGIKVRESTGTGDLAEAERFLAMRVQQIRNIALYGEREKHTIDEACARYIVENKERRGIKRQAFALKNMVDWFGGLDIAQIRAEIFADYIEARKVSPSTIKREMGALRAVLSQAATAWRDCNGHYWLERVPALPVMTLHPKKPRPITQEEQARLFKELPIHMKNMALFAVNTGCRVEEICGLRWEWEHEVSESHRTVFVIPGSVTKNGYEKMVPLNAVASSVVNLQRGKSDEFVFTYKGDRIVRMTNTSWKNARVKAGLKDVRVHDLRHTFAMRLRSLDVPQEDISDLMGHRHGTMTLHYSKATIERLMDGVDKLVSADRKPDLVLIRKAG